MLQRLNDKAIRELPPIEPGLGEYSPDFRPHAATDSALKDSSLALGVEISSKWISTGEIPETLFEPCDAIWIAFGRPHRSMSKTLLAIRHAREALHGRSF